MSKLKSGGFYWARNLYQSDAFLSLGKNSMKILIAMLDVRMLNPLLKHNKKQGKVKTHERFTNLNDIEMPYKTLNKKYKIPEQSIPRAIDELLAKGFIKIMHGGGRGEHDKAVYALIDDYLDWADGKIFRRRERDVKRGFQGKMLGVMENPRSKCESYTHSENEPFVSQNVSL